MMKIKFLCLGLFTTFLAQSQDPKTVYYNANWEVTSMKFGKYYRNSGFNPQTLKFDSIVVDHYLDGKPEMTGKYANGLKEGEFVFYYPDQTIRLISSYYQNKRAGLWTLYFENGKVNKVIEYKDDRERMINSYDSLGNSVLKNMTGVCAFDIFMNSYFNCFTQRNNYPNGSEKYSIKGKLKDGYKQGIWTVKNYRKISYLISGNNWRTEEEPVIIYKIKFDAGRLIEGYYYPPEGKKQKIIADNFTYLMVEPEKISITEALYCEQGQLIKQNYLTKAIQNRNKTPIEKVTLDSESDIAEYFNSSYSLYSMNCTDTIRMTIRLRFDDQSNVSLVSISPKIPATFEKEANKVISSISKVRIHSRYDYVFSYRVNCINELDFKK